MSTPIFSLELAEAVLRDVQEENDDYYDPWDSYRDLVDSATKAFMSENYND